MKIVVLTTETPHHAHFVRELSATHRGVEAVCETGYPQTHPYETKHPFEEMRDDYEWGCWFHGRRTSISELTSTSCFNNINDNEAVSAIRRSKPDLLIVFGTGRLKEPVIEINPRRILNLHGGDPERYRGLDTHLWAIYHRDYSALVTTLHRVDRGLDTGDIVLQDTIPLSSGMPLCTLRRYNTETCVKLALIAVDMITRFGDVISRPQRKKGRYYSAMPAVLKEVCKNKFETYTAGGISGH
jgi:methionyl-tRNA formyltransferase